MKFIVALLALLASDAAMAQPQHQTFKDANGREVGRSVSDDRNAVFYDAMDRNIGRSVTDTEATRRSTTRWVATPDARPPTATRRPPTTTSVVGQGSIQGSK
jgi:hypothetical protein